MNEVEFALIERLLARPGEEAKRAYDLLRHESQKNINDAVDVICKPLNPVILELAERTVTEQKINCSSAAIYAKDEIIYAFADGNRHARLMLVERVLKRGVNDKKYERYLKQQRSWLLLVTK